MSLEKKVLYIDFKKKYIKNTNLAVGMYQRESCVDVSSISVSEELVVDFDTHFSNWVKHQDKEIQSKLFASKNQFYTSVAEPLFKWLSAIELAIEKFEPDFIDFGEIYFHQLIFTYEAEGEVNRKFFYKSNYYLPVILLNYFKSKNIKAVVTFTKKSSFMPFLSFYIRNLSLLGYGFFKGVVRKLYRSSGTNKFGLDLPDKNKIGLLVRNKIQVQFAQKISTLRPESFEFLSYEQIGSRSSCSNNLREQELMHVNLNNQLSMYDLASEYIKGLLSLFRPNGVKDNTHISVMNGSLKFPMYYGAKEIIVRAVDMELLYKSLSLCRGMKMVSFDMLTPHAHYVKKALGERNITQIQTTLMLGKPEPDFVVGKNFLLTDKISYEGVSTFNQRFSSKLRYLETPKHLNVSKKIEFNDKVHRIVYFTQPMEQDVEKSLLNSLQNICESKGIALIIKVHPRQSSECYMSFNKAIITSECIDLKDFDLAITRWSSIAIDCWLARLPIVFIRSTGYSRIIEADFLPKGYTGDLRSINALEEHILNRYTSFVKDYIRFLKEIEKPIDKTYAFELIEKSF
ncbi:MULTISPECIES: hypothetical protein [Gammaproteobacteria]|uniref:hypothetical protein n=1 Tax=Gammaproteobacteria TaxID=1236 RepID=UPI000DCFB92D|nr:MULTISPECIES: hypothetical protein [Gammaproteobacteria]RTE86062.1 hypothetical protein DQX04_05685 [Aliidiomarina sp. B3213]TCZ91416.1 hypothetical protein EYQ95_05695 [Lysobacter sp. N42]